MQFDNNYLKDYFNNEKENEKINSEVFNINPKLKYPRKNSHNPNVHKKNDENVQLKRELSLKIPNHSEDIHFRDRRAKSISFADISQLSDSTPNYMENYKSNHTNRSQSYHSPNVTERKKYSGITRHRSYSNLNGTTTLAKKSSFRKPKVLLNSKEHIRRLKKMSSISAINLKQNNEENEENKSKTIKRRYSIDAPSSPKVYNFSDIYFNDKFTEDSYSISDLPPNTLYHELKQAHEKELLEKELENKDNELDEETIYYDSDSNLHKVKLKETEEEENGSFLNLLLKYLEDSINKENHNSIKSNINRKIKKEHSWDIIDNNEEDVSNDIIEKDIKEDTFEDSYFSGNSQYMEEESEIHKQEELLESIFNDVIKSFYGYQTKFYSVILKLISFLLYNGGKLELGSHLLKYILKDKLGINMSSSDDSSLSSLDVNNHINHFGNDEIEYITLNDIKEAKRHEKIRKKGYKSLNKFWMIVHNIFIFLFLYIFLINYHFNDMNNIPSYVSNIRKQNLENNKKYYHIFLFNNNNNNNNNVNNNIKNQDSIWIQSTPIIWFSLNSNHDFFENEKSFIDEFTRKKVYHKYLETEEGNNNIIYKEKNYIKNENKFFDIIEKFTPWKTLLIFECILFSAQLGFQYFIMDEIVPFFKPASYTSVLFLNQIINFFIQYKVIWKILYNDLCLYIFILGIYIVLFMN